MLEKSHSGQTMMEYILLFAVIIVVVLIALAPQGFVTKAIDESLDLSIQGIENMANDVFYNLADE